MNHFQDVFLRGTLTAVEPFTFTEPGGETRKAGEATIPVLPTIGGRYYVPGSMFRGALRRAATRELFDIADGRRFDMDEYLATVLGGVMNGKGEGDKKGGTNRLGLAIETCEGNPVIELFGCMAPLTIPGCIAVSHALARAARDGHDALVRASRSNPAERDRVLTSEVTDDAFETAYRAKLEKAGERSAASASEKKARRERSAARVADDAEAQAKADAEVRDAREQKKSNKEVQVQQLLNYPFIPPGTEFDSTIRLMRVSERGLAVFARAFDRFAAFARLGGHSGQGMGLMDGAWEILARPSEGSLVAPVAIGSVSFKGEDYAPALWQGAPAQWKEAAPAADDVCYLAAKGAKEAA